MIVVEGYSLITPINNFHKKVQQYLLKTNHLLTIHFLLDIVLVMIIVKDLNFGHILEEVILTFIVNNMTVKTHGMY